MIIAGNSHFELFDLPGIQKIPIKSSIKNIVNTIKMNNHKIVVQASMDPLFNGIGSTLMHYYKKNSKDNVSHETYIGIPDIDYNIQNLIVQI